MNFFWIKLKVKVNYTQFFFSYSYYYVTENITGIGNTFIINRPPGTVFHSGLMF